MNKSIAAFVAIGMLAICAPATGAETAWQPIDISKSNVSFVGDVSFIKSRDWRRRSNGTQERLKFSGGEIFYEELYFSGGQWQFIDEKNYLENMLAKGLNKKSQDYKPGDFTKRDFGKFSLLYLTPQSSTTKCFLGLAAEARDGRTWHMNVTACRALNSKSIAKFEDDILDILTRIGFDGGELNKTRDALIPQPKADTKSAKAESKPVAKKAQPSEAAAAPIAADYPKLGPVATILEGSIIKDSLRQYIPGYQALTGAKALAMTEDGQKLYWLNRAAGKESVAIESAKTNCQTKSKLPCYVIAVNDELAVNLDAIKNKTFK